MRLSASTERVFGHVPALHSKFHYADRIGPSGLDSYRGSNVKLDKKESIIMQG